MNERFAPIELRVAASRNMLLVVRLTTAGAVTRAGLTLDQTESFKLVAEEAFGCFLTQTLPPARLCLCYTCTDDVLNLTVTAEGGPASAGTLGPDEAEVMRCILSGLCDRAELTLENGRVSRVVVAAARQ